MRGTKIGDKDGAERIEESVRGRLTTRELGENTTTLQQMKRPLPVVMRSTPVPLFSAGCQGTQGVSCLDDVVPP